MSFKKKKLWDHQGKMKAYQMYNQGYDDPVTAYQILTDEQMPDEEVVENQVEFEGFEENKGGHLK